jgi:hypothetical protein
MATDPYADLRAALAAHDLRDDDWCLCREPGDRMCAVHGPAINASIVAVLLAERDRLSAEATDD